MIFKELEGLIEKKLWMNSWNNMRWNSLYLFYNLEMNIQLAFDLRLQPEKYLVDMGKQ